MINQTNDKKNKNKCNGECSPNFSICTIMVSDFVVWRILWIFRRSLLILCSLFVLYWGRFHLSRVSWLRIRERLLMSLLRRLLIGLFWRKVRSICLVRSSRISGRIPIWSNFCEQVQIPWKKSSSDRSQKVSRKARTNSCSWKNNLNSYLRTQVSLMRIQIRWWIIYSMSSNCQRKVFIIISSLKLFSGWLWH